MSILLSHHGTLALSVGELNSRKVLVIASEVTAIAGKSRPMVLSFFILEDVDSSRSMDNEDVSDSRDASSL